MATPLLDAIVIEPSTPATRAVIWLHGLGADGSDFEPIVPQLGLPAFMATRFVFPHATPRPVTVNMGYVMRAWYDIKSLERTEEDEAGVLGSEQQVQALIRREIERGVPAGRIVLAGFSQGGAMALRTGLCYPERLAGIMGLSCYLPIAHRLAADAHPANRTTPVFIAHGSHDEVVPLELGQMSETYLKAQGYYTTWRTYPIGHNVSPQEIADLGAWLRTVLA